MDPQPDPREESTVQTNLVLYGSAAESHYGCRDEPTRKRIGGTNRLTYYGPQAKVEDSRSWEYQNTHRKLLCVVVLTLDSRNKKPNPPSTKVF